MLVTVFAKTYQAVKGELFSDKVLSKVIIMVQSCATKTILQLSQSVLNLKAVLFFFVYFSLCRLKSMRRKQENTE